MKGDSSQPCSQSLLVDFKAIGVSIVSPQHLDGFPVSSRNSFSCPNPNIPSFKQICPPLNLCDVASVVEVSSVLNLAFIQQKMEMNSSKIFMSFQFQKEQKQRQDGNGVVFFDIFQQQHKQMFWELILQYDCCNGM